MRNNEMSLYPLRAVQVHPPLANFVAVPVNGDLRRLLSLPAESKGVETAMDHEGFHNGWNAALRHMRQHSDTLLPEIERLIFNDPCGEVSAGRHLQRRDWFDGRYAQAFHGQ